MLVFLMNVETVYIPKTDYLAVMSEFLQGQLGVIV